jgi:hypothetical protein
MSDFQFPKTFSSKLQFPKALPDGVDLSHHLWLKLTALTLPEGGAAAGMSSTGQSTNARMGITAEPEGTEIKLLMPESFQLGLSHEWAAYDSLTAKLAEKAAAYYKSVTGAASVMGGINSFLKSIAGGDWAGLGKALMGSGSIVNTRIDSPMVYKASSPIEYNIAFEFVVFGKNDVEDLQSIIKKLLMLSSPKKPDTNSTLSQAPIFIKPPNVFRVESIVPALSKSSSVNIINMNLAALTSIQPNWKAPYYKGGAKAVGLTLTFRDITPVFDSNFNLGASVTVSAAGGIPKVM